MPTKTTISQSVDAPNRPGWWRIDYKEVTRREGKLAVAWVDLSVEVEVYPLEPVGGELCVWGEEIGGCFDGPSQVWDTDEWLGHIPVRCVPGQFIEPLFTFVRPPSSERE